MRTWMSLPAIAGPPPADATPAPSVGPISKCRAALSNPPQPGSISVDDKYMPATKPVSVTLIFTPPTIATLPPPGLDPSVLCAFNGQVPMSPTACTIILNAVLASTDLNPASITAVAAHPGLIACAGAAPCPGEPLGAAPVGSATIVHGDRAVYVNAWAAEGSVVLTEIVPTPSPS
jgi:hypothetical protein